MSGILFRDSWEEELITAIDSQHVAHLERMLRDPRREDRLREYEGDLLTSEVSPLHHAASVGSNPTLIRTLVRTGRANPNAYQSLIGGRTRVTPLHVAIRDLRPDAVETLIESARVEAEKFYQKGNKTAGTRLRKLMQDLKNSPMLHSSS